MIVKSVLSRIIAYEFYRLNAGFFLVISGLTFGFMSGIEHLALGLFFISSPSAMLIPLVVWAIYATKVVAFNKEVIKKPENEFCFHVNLFSTQTKITSLLFVTVHELAPAILYGSFLILLGFKNDIYLSPLIALCGLAILHAITSFILYHDLKNLNKETHNWFLKRWLDKQWRKSYGQMMLEWLGRREPIALIGSKVIAYALVWGTIQIYKNDSYDLRLMGLGTTFAFMANTTLLYHLHTFENFHLSITRNLPVPFLQRLSYIIIIFLFLCLPEVGLILTQFPQNFSTVSSLLHVLYGISLLTAIYGLLYTKAWSLENLSKCCLFLVLLYFILILFKIPLLALIAINLALGVILLKKHYYSFEYVEN